MTTHKTTLEVGLLLRRQVRASLDFAGVRWTEYKGWTSSTFIVRGSEEEIDAVLAWVRRINGRTL